MKILQDYFMGFRVLFMDIETTGLVSERNKVILCGLLPFEDEAKESIQLFSNSKSEEKLLLQDMIPYLDAADVIITYNGDSFDLPFLNKRLQKNGFDYQIPGYKSFDLYRVLRNTSFSTILRNLKQKTVEEFMGISEERSDQISGRDCIDCYQSYLETGDISFKEAILLHNRDDLFQLKKLMAILVHIDLHEAMYHNGFNISQAGRKIAISTIKFRSGVLHVKGYHEGVPMDYIRFSDPYDVNLSTESQKFSIDIPYSKDETYTYVDLTQFNIDQQGLDKYPGYVNDYLILKNGNSLCYAEINQLIRRIGREILSNF